LVGDMCGAATGEGEQQGLFAKHPKLSEMSRAIAEGAASPCAAFEREREGGPID
jgi:hypothetical protein